MGIKLWAVLVVVISCASTSAVAQQEVEPLIQIGRIQEKQINESSGLSLASNGGLWTINDSGNKPELYLLKKDGALDLTVSLTNAKNIDWESMCLANIDGNNFIFVADVGDNARRRKSVSLYVLQEPNLTKLPRNPTISAKCTKIEFVYEDGPHNCEAVAVDEVGKSILLVEKVYVDDRRQTQPGIYRLPLVTKAPSKKLIAKRVGDFVVRNVTGMDISRDGKRLIIRDYLRAYLFENPQSASWLTVLRDSKPTTVPCPLQLQGETICFSQDGTGVFLTSEKRKQPIWKVALPEPTRSGEK